MIDQLIRQLRRDEGVRPCVYADHLGYMTIGVGRLVDERRPGSGLRESEMDLLLLNDITDRLQSLGNALPWFAGLDEVRKGVLINMAFQLGTRGLLNFRRTLALVEARDYAAASVEMLASTWAQQTPERAQRMAKQMRTGVWQ